MVSVRAGELRKICSARVGKLREKIGQSWRLRVHPQDTSKPVYVQSNGAVKWNFGEVEVPTVELLTEKNAIEVQDIRELGMGCHPMGLVCK